MKNQHEKTDEIFNLARNGKGLRKFVSETLLDIRRAVQGERRRMKPQQIVNEQERYALRVAPDSLVAAGARLKIAMRNFLKEIKKER